MASSKKTQNNVVIDNLYIDEKPIDITEKVKEGIHEVVPIIIDIDVTLIPKVIVSLKKI